MRPFATAFHNGHAETPLYRFSLADGTPVTAQTRSDLCRNPNSNEPLCFRSTHLLQRWPKGHFASSRGGLWSRQPREGLTVFSVPSFREQNSFRGTQVGGVRPQSLSASNPNQQMNAVLSGGGMNLPYGMAEQGNVAQRGAPPYAGGHRINQMNPVHPMNAMGPINPMSSMNAMNQMGPMNPMGHHGMHQHQHQQMASFHGGGPGLGAGAYGMGVTSPPLASPGINGPPHNVMGSPRVRGSPKMGASPFSPGGTARVSRSPDSFSFSVVTKSKSVNWFHPSSPAIHSFLGLNSPMSSGHPGNSGGGTTTFSSSSLNALQAISEGVGNPLTSPGAHKPDSSPSINSTNQVAGGGACKSSLPSHCESKSPGSSLGAAAEHHHPRTPSGECASDKPDSQAGREAGPNMGESNRRPPDKSHKKLLQLLTSPADELVPAKHAPSSGLGSTPDVKDATTGGTSPSSSTGAPPSAGGGGHGAVSSSGNAGHFTSQSLQEKHKILHKLLKNGNTPDEVARITAEATGKSSLESPGASEAGAAAVAGGRASESKQEQHSPKKEVSHALLHYYLLNKDDSKEGADIKPKLEELEARGVPGPGVSSSEGHSLDGKVKLEPSDEVITAASLLPSVSAVKRFRSPFRVPTIQVETLETILGTRNVSGFFPEPDSRSGKEVGNKQGALPDSFLGKTNSTCGRWDCYRASALFSFALERDRGPVTPGQRGACQRALSVDAKPMGGEASVGVGLAGRRNMLCPTLIKQENTDAPIRPGGLPNGFPGVCPPRGHPTSTSFFLFL